MVLLSKPYCYSWAETWLVLWLRLEVVEMRTGYDGRREMIGEHMRLRFCLEMELSSMGRLLFGMVAEVRTIFRTWVSACAEQ